MSEFEPFRKIGRLSRDIVITEKIDGTNGIVRIGQDGAFEVGSRTQWITPERDNHGFAGWAYFHGIRQQRSKDGAAYLDRGSEKGTWKVGFESVPQGGADRNDFSVCQETTQQWERA